MPLDFDYLAARRAGYSDDDILNGLKQHGMLDFDLDAARKAGYSSSDILATLAKEPEQPKPEEPSAWRRAGDVGIAALKGAIGVPETAVGLADIVTGGYAGKLAEEAGFRPREAKAFLDEYLSPQQQEANRKVEQAKGFVESAKTMLQNPSTIGMAAIESLPSMGAGGFVGRGVGAATKIAPYLAGAIGEGVVGAGQAAETIRQRSDDGLLSAGQIGDVLASGAGTAAFGAAGGRIAQKLGISDVDTMLAGGEAGLTSKGVTRRLLEGGISEGVFEELPQSVQEQVWQNAALNKPLLEGVPEQAAQGLLTGGLMGGIGGAGFHANAKEEPAPQQEEPPLLLENKEDPLISFPDGSVGRQSDVDSYLASLPEDEQIPARARLLGLGEQTAQPQVDDIEKAASVDDAIATAEAVINAPTDSEIELKNRQIDEAFARYRDEQSAQRQADFDLAEQQRRDQEFSAAQEQDRQQQVEQANILTQAQGFDAEEPTAMQLAMQKAQERRARALTPVSQREEIAPSEPISQAAEPIQEVRNDTNTAPADLYDAGIRPGGNLPVAVQQDISQGTSTPTLQLGSEQRASTEGTGNVRADGLPPANGPLVEQPALAAPAVQVNTSPELDRRVNQAERRRVQEMTPEEMQRALLTSDKTGLPSQRAFDEHMAENPGQPVLYGDLDDFKSLNDKYGHDGADQILQGVGMVKAAVAKQVGVDAFHRSGDEFLAAHPESAKLESYGKLLQNTLADTTFTIRQADGSVVTHKGVGFSYGTGQNTAAAESQAAGQKEERRIAGLRAGSRGVVSSVAERGQVDQRDATGRTGTETTALDQQQALSLLEQSDLPTAERIKMRAALRRGDVSPEDIAAELNKPVAQPQAVEIQSQAEEAPQSAEPPMQSRSATTSGIGKSDLEQAIAPLRSKWQGFKNIEIVQSHSELPSTLRSQADGATEGLYDPATGKVHLIASAIKSPERAAWVAVHEVVGHGGLRMLKDQSVDSAMKVAGANKFVRELSDAIAKDRQSSASIEEAIAELSAAVETDDFSELEKRYGVSVPSTARNGIRATVARVIESIRRFLSNILGKPVSDVSDKEVRDLISRQRAAVEGKTPEAKQESRQGEPAMASSTEKTIDVGGKGSPISDGKSKRMAATDKATGSAGTPGVDKPSILQSRAPSSAWNPPEESTLDDLIYSMQDKQIDLKKVVQEIQKVSGEIKDEFNPYLQEELFHGRSAKGVTDFLDNELRPLLQEMRMRGVSMDEFEEYLWNRHAEERNEQIASINDQMPDGGSGIKTADARKYLAGLSQSKRKAFESLAKKIDAINKNTRQVLVDSGLEKQSTVDAWESAYQHYVPLQREDVETGGNGTGQGFSVRGSSTRRAVGSDKRVANIIANIAMQREKAIVRGEKNRVSNALYGLVKTNPNPDFWSVDEAPKERVVQTVGGKDHVVERIVPGFRNQDNVIHTRINGDDHFIIMNERNARGMRMAMAIKNLDADQLGRVLSATSKATRYFASINTQFNPIFGVINLMRDTQGALLNLSTTAIRGEQKKVLGYTVDAIRGIYADLRARRDGTTPNSAWANLWEEFQNAGGQTGYRDQYSNAQQRAEAIEREIKSLDKHPALKVGGAIFDWLSDYNETMENGVRLAAYRAAKEKGLSNEQAASLAKNLTVNFNRKGQVATQMGALFAFFNASVQGTARLAETLTGPTGKKIIYGGILLGSMQALLMAGAGMGDDDPPEFVRERSLILPIGDGKYISLPMPLGFHVLPSLGRIPTEFVLNGFRNPTGRIADMIGLFADTFNPIGNAGLSLQTVAPTVVDPLAALSENRDWTGKPIAKQDFNPLAPTPGYSRAKDTATTWSKGIAYALNRISGGTDYKPGLISPTPDQLDYLIGQATGGVGRELAKTEQTVTSAFNGEEMPTYKIPLVGRFVGNTKEQASQGGKFYEAVKRLNEHEAEIKGLRMEGKAADAAEYIRDNPEATLVPLANRVEHEVQKLRKLKRDAVEKDQANRVQVLEKLITARMALLNDRIAALQEKAR